MAQGSILRLVVVLAGGLTLAGCADGQMPDFLRGSGGAGTTTEANTTTRTVERDVEAPEIFQAVENGLWDGRPSLGGVWVAHPDAVDPERVIIRNEANGKFVVGVLYRPERQPVGPRFQVSSDAADALGMLAGQPAKLSVTALKREEVPVETPAPAAPTDSEGTLASAPAVATATLDDPIAAAAAALDTAEGKPAATTAAAAATTTAAAAAPAPSSSALSKPYIQIGIFSVETNAKNTAESLRQAGMVPTIKQGKMNGKDFWRVIVGPATSSAERATLLKKIKGLGFNDAYFVSN